VARYDVLIKNGRVFDGLGSPSLLRHVGIRDGKVIAMSEAPLRDEDATRVIDARNKWVLPGFVDAHTHYDAEVLVAPGLQESVRHGVTTVFMGSCSLSSIHSSAVDCADLFTRVEALPRRHVLSALEAQKTWTSAKEYIRHLESLPLGPHVAAFVGHSDLRASVMGLGRATDPAARPEREEIHQMQTLLEEGLDAGLLGLSGMLGTIDKLDGERYRSRPLPSTFARGSELRTLYGILRRRRRVLQSAPDFTRPWTSLSFFAAAMGGLLRKPLKISLLTAADAKAMRLVTWLVVTVTGIFNRLFGGKLRWQHLPVPFQIFADGIDQVVFEEFGAGRAALHLRDECERNRLFQNEGYRRSFRRACADRLAPKLWNRNFHEVDILACPDASVVGLTIGQVADRRGVHPVDAFLDLVVEHGHALRWATTIANDRPEVLDWLSAHPSVHIGFADSGAHLRNMAFYNAPIRLLRRVWEAESRGEPFMTVERAVYRVTGELADWFGVDAGTLRLGGRADVAIIDPAGLDASVDGMHEAPMPEFAGLARMVNRSDHAVVATLISGKVVFEGGAFAAGYGQAFRTGCFLRADQVTPPAEPALQGKAEAA
jgi:N-acyl-D-aspartate/D-glutamate deacylase